ncbi:hypothetical protein BJ986_002388 [Phycicoccus badiiscoriae]|uniref:Uncharacterized protein n=1 Tax=Pedococcus badiiscoriae TaxID=642776 RepID=A0A852WJW1_9MICO|nr:hypothetical protein [Pedococcus badiiscoriae]NYG07901.1 hypothetical protein [Pedococcus badiiscoriae]
MPDRSARAKPMAPLPGAAPGIQPFVHLTPISTPDAARYALAAEAETSVLDPAGMRRLWVRDLSALVALVLAVLMAVLAVRGIAYGESEDVLPILVPFMIVVNLANASSVFFPAALCRALPAPGVIPKLPAARWRWYRQLRQEPTTAAPSGAWPPGAEAYALLSGAASVHSVAASWLCERAGLPAVVGAAWIASLRGQGWLNGGGRTLGLASLPETHLQVTPAGRAALQAERARITALAAG